MLGIDIGSRYIKLVALGRRRGQWQLQSCVAYKIPPEFVGDRSGSLASAMRLLPSAITDKLPAVGIALSVADVIVKAVQLPSHLTDDQLDMALRMELEPALGAAADSMCLDYRRGAQQVLAVACPQPVMDKSLAAFEALAIKPVLVGVDAMLIADSLRPDSGDGRVTLYVDAGASGIRLCSVRAGMPVYHRSHALPDQGSCVDDPAAYLLLLRRAIQHYRMFDMLSKPDAIVVYGGAADLPQLPDIVQQSFGLTAQLVNPFARFDVCDADSGVLPADFHAGAFTLACALACQAGTCV